MKIAVMSDLHVGLAARAKDLCPHPTPQQRNNLARYNRKFEDSYRKKFMSFIKDDEITADYLMLPGDLTNSSHPREVKIASEFILEAAKAMGVSQNRIMFVPGNHDVDWTVFDPTDDTGITWKRRYDPMKDSSFHFINVINQGEGCVFEKPHFIVWSFDELIVVGYNSASHDTPAPKDDVHHGVIDLDHLNLINDYLDTLGEPDERVRLFMVHHHVIDFSDPIPGTADFSHLTDADKLLTLLHVKGFDLLIHGHKHHPRFETHTTHTYPHLLILCAGSFSVEIDTQYAGTIDNQFHLMTIDGRAGCENRIKGEITSWTYNNSKGWNPSNQSTSGIHHVIPFGSYLMPNELDNRLEPFVREWFSKHEHILWKDLVDEFPDLEHLPLDSAIAAFARLGKKLNKQDMYETRKDLILY